MTLLSISTLTALLQRNTSLSSAVALCTFLALNATKTSVFLAASNANGKPVGLLKWKKR